MPGERIHHAPTHHHHRPTPPPTRHPNSNHTCRKPRRRVVAQLPAQSSRNTKSPRRRWFSFDQSAVASGWKKSATTPPGKPPSGGPTKTELPRMIPDFSFGQQVKSVWWLAQADFKFIAHSGAFRSVLAAGALFIAVVLLHINPQTDTKILPVTWAVLGIPILFFRCSCRDLRSCTRACWCTVPKPPE